MKNIKIVFRTMELPKFMFLLNVKKIVFCSKTDNLPKMFSLRPCGTNRLLLNVIIVLSPLPTCLVQKPNTHTAIKVTITDLMGIAKL